MSIRTNIQINNSVTNTSANSSALRTPLSNVGNKLDYSVTVDAEVDLGSVTDVSEMFIKCVSGDALLVSLDGTTYPIRLTSGAANVFSLSPGTELQTIEPVADASGSLNNTYFTLEGDSGVWLVWMNVNSAGSAPSGGQDSTLEVAIDTDETKPNVASAIYAAMIASTPFLADFAVSFTTPVISVTDLVAGARTGIADAGSTGFTVSTLRAGETVPTVHLKSEGTSLVTTLVTSV